MTSVELPVPNGLMVRDAVAQVAERIQGVENLAAGRCGNPLVASSGQRRGPSERPCSYGVLHRLTQKPNPKTETSRPSVIGLLRLAIVSFAFSTA